MAEKQSSEKKRTVSNAIDELRDGMNQIGSALDRVHSSLDRVGFTAETAQFARLISEEFGLSSPDVLFKSLSLFKLAAEQEAKGNRLAFLDPDDEIVTEVPGILEPLGLTETAGA